ncbi:hypothetical protein CTAYLR_008223 [Chrysophaeum taylorii]|uniref:tRNA-dihydrouridine(47) synthase [NAD(P)(+)] n=1 Tax=Chrysophaeum taylorii TaxID=2483200 RepID=A0AAD7UJ70_9STRA|nr:hypothetical protein CTAYLR_008223 [Chrysophaeum taylorii]
MKTQEIVEAIAGKAILAPLTRGGTPAFRALCASYGAEITMGEMAFAKFLLKGDRKEAARLRRHESETVFGAQIATNTIDEGARACAVAAERGCDWVDLNCGCPIYEATRRGLGSALLRKPPKLARLVSGIVAESDLAVSVKIRLSPSGDDDVNFPEVLELLSELGDLAPAFVSVHGRTTTARYKTAANWTAVEAAARGPLPVVGNGDILTYYEAEARREAAPSTHAIMIGRGALTTPWLFDELRSRDVWLPRAAERVDVYWHLATLFKAHFGDDERGRSAAWYFFPWHFDFLTRWRPLPEDAFGDMAKRRPLVQSSREVDDVLIKLEGPLSSLDPLEQLLRCPIPEAHNLMAAALWDAGSSKDAVAALDRLATPDNLATWAAAKTAASGTADELEGHTPRRGKRKSQ